MSLFDTFIAPCPNCGTIIEVQTKVFYEPALREFHPWVPLDLDESETFISITYRGDEQDACPSCKHIPIIVVKNQMFEGYR